MRYSNRVSFEVSGDYALFSDPVTRVGGEKCSYPIPTYEALKGILHSVYWKPTFIWIIDRVRVMNPIQTEVKGMRPIRYASTYMASGNDLSYYTYLKKCRYQVEAHFEWNQNACREALAGDRNEDKHYQIALRYIKKGGRRDIFLGTRECQGYVEPCAFGEGAGAYDETPERAFGFMYHGLTYADEAYSEATKGQLTARFWYPVMRSGIIDFIRPEACTIVKTIGPMKEKIFDKASNNFSGLDEFKEAE